MRVPETPRPPRPDDVGTLWSLRRGSCSARCALLTSPGRWEVRVLVDGTMLLTERCVRVDEAFALAEHWKRQLLDQGWAQVVPRRRPAGAA